jgi:hypothetical protein
MHPSLQAGNERQKVKIGCGQRKVEREGGGGSGFLNGIAWESVGLMTV